MPRQIDSLPANIFKKESKPQGYSGRVAVFQLLDSDGILVMEDTQLGTYQLASTLLGRMHELGGRDAGYHTGLRWK